MVEPVSNTPRGAGPAPAPVLPLGVVDDAAAPPGVSSAPSGGAEASGPMPWVQRPDRRAEVKVLQRLLQANGIDCGPIDGYLGPVTEVALRRFQAARGLVVDGAAGPQTWGALGLVGAPRGDRLSPSLAPIGPPSQLDLPPVERRRTEGPLPDAPGPEGPGVPGPAEDALRERLMANLANPARGKRGKCLRYANDVIVAAGGHAVAGQARRAVGQTREGRGQPVAYLDTLARNGTLKVGDLIYANRQPGADPSSNDLSLGPHWFIYAGQGQFIDQHGIKSAAEMARFLPGRQLDTIFHPFG